MHNRTPFKKLAFLAVPLALMLCPSQGFASYGADGFTGTLIAQAKPSGASADRHHQMAKELGLSPEQSKKVKATMEQGRAQSRALRQKLKAKRQAMMQYVQSPNATEAGARNLNAEINELQRQLGEIRLKTWFSMRSELTPAQLQKLKAIKAKRRAQRPKGAYSEGGDF